MTAAATTDRPLVAVRELGKSFDTRRGLRRLTQSRAGHIVHALDGGAQVAVFTSGT